MNKGSKISIKGELVEAFKNSPYANRSLTSFVNEKLEFFLSLSPEEEWKLRGIILGFSTPAPTTQTVEEVKKPATRKYPSKDEVEKLMEVDSKDLDFDDEL